MTDQSTITPEQKNEARKEAKRQADRDRRAAIKKVDEVATKADFGSHGQMLYGDLNADQRKRALDADKHAGLGAKALGDFILTGMGLRDQQAVAKTGAARQKAAAKTESRVRTAKDPEASALVVKAVAIITDEETGEKILKSAFLPKDAREFLDEFEVTKPDSSIIITSRRRADLRVEFNRAELEAFAISKEKLPGVRKNLATLGSGTRLWGGKLAVFILAS